MADWQRLDENGLTDLPLQFGALALTFGVNATLGLANYIAGHGLGWLAVAAIFYPLTWLCAVCGVRVRDHLEPA